jgi:hypothetical protein
MTKDAERISRIITERMGLCWHYLNHWNLWEDGFPVKCVRCDQTWNKFPLTLDWPNTDYTDPTRLCELIRWAKDDSKHPGWTWKQFILWLYQRQSYLVVEFRVDWNLVPVDMTSQPEAAVWLAQWLEEGR